MNEYNSGTILKKYGMLTLLFAIFLSVYAPVNAALPVDTFQYHNDDEVVTVSGKHFAKLEDKNGNLRVGDVIQHNGFSAVEKSTTNLGASQSTFWLKLYVHNSTDVKDLKLTLQQPLIDFVEVYVVSPNGSVTKSTITKHKPYDAREYQQLDYIFDLDIQTGHTQLVLIKVKSATPLVLPFKAGTKEQVFKEATNKELTLGFYSGIILVMGIYNIFVFFSVRDKSYLLYVFYIITIGLTQITLQDFTFKYYWPSSSWMALQGPVLFSVISSVAALQFIKEFLRTKEHVPKLHIGIQVGIGLFLISAILNLLGMRMAGFQLMQLATAVSSLYALYVSYRIYRMNYRPAKFFLLAWSILLVGAVVFVLKDFGIIPFNAFTSAALQISSVIEIVLLSFALADKINMFRKEKEESQAQAMAALEENARITSEQNVILETKVSERTVELRKSNDELSKTLSDLKEAEAQLVESEKMASLGQLTAGIAHEINNPINFVTSNVKPLKRDVDMLIDMLNTVEEISLSNDSIDEKKEKIAELKEEYDFDYLKTEIDYLLKGITEGSTRTAEIVKGLRVFSRLDEDDLKKANINEGLDSTLIIVNNLLDNKVKVEKNYSSLPLVECYPGKLNQVFLNMISNALHAIKDRYKDETGGILTLSTYHDENTVSVSIKDNGIGMDEATQKKIFEPFFTTKEVGEGTGLGMSIAYNTINKHNGNIELISEPGVGTEFIIHVPIVHVNEENS